MNWEKIDDYTKRARIKGGWLVKHESIIINNDTGVDHVSVMMAFVPDPMHGWTL